jgi:catechol 2,3-dioxygenase-like lactoylglutathione lyase family enzyme
MTHAKRPGNLNHVSVTTADLDRSLAFYVDLLGLSVMGTGQTTSRELEEIIGLGPVDLRWAELDLGAGQFLELFEYVSPRGQATQSATADPGSVHFALAVTEIDSIYDRLGAAGVVTRSAPIELKGGDWKGARALYALDPDGVTVELIEFPPG